MNRKTLALLCAIGMTAAVASADSITVTNTAAMGSSGGTACGGGPCGMQLFHDNSTVAFVQDNTPEAESQYRFEFLFNPNDISPENGNWRHTIFWAQSNNTRPGNGICPVNPAAKIPAFRVFATFRLDGGVGGARYGVRAVMFGNICGKVGTDNIDIVKNGPNKICGYWQQAVNSTALGEGGIAVVGENDACPPFGDAAYATASIRNFELAVEQAQMGSIARNNFNRGESGDMYFDEFASYRTMAP